MNEPQSQLKSHLRRKSFNLLRGDTAPMFELMPARQKPRVVLFFRPEHQHDLCQHRKIGRSGWALKAQSLESAGLFRA